MIQGRQEEGNVEMDDAQAIRMVLDGQADMFAVLVRRHQDYLFALLRRHLPVSEVAEAAQDAFVRAFEKLSQLRQPGSFRAWLSSMALNRAIRYWREVSSRREVSLTPQEEGSGDWLESYLADDAKQRHEAFLHRREASSVVSWLLSHVKPEDRIALGLFYAGEHELTEIAAMLGWSLEKVKVRLHRARKAMAKIMQDEYRQGRRT